MLLRINLDDRGETVKQYPCMGGIYGGAERVVVWLGGMQMEVRSLHQRETGTE